ncbi:hypothetical protein GRF29_69g1092002 [Pseudopithomyces chartarum]|uniref:Uncharacterized protein n=1 Tax=Pseudopithomyces chartarum TaxID=1892770 RepID=A0AAN6M1A6_9PLEO|nr:hypothetical protein GRF29_69g1092002 [Pseudopithomyces chartarum]
MATKRKAAQMAPADEDPVDPSDELMFLCLGGGNEVGRSCHILQYKGKTVMLDAGMHPAHIGMMALPYYDTFDLSTVDVLLISHIEEPRPYGQPLTSQSFHVDHAASLPYVLAKTNFKGRVFMTHATKAIYKWLIADSVRVGNMGSSAENTVSMYTEQDHNKTFPNIETIDFYTTHTVAGIRITPYPAGHVLGAAMFQIEIAGLKVLFTGDYSREDDRHLVSASIPKGVKIDVLITESTFGISTHTPRVQREAQLMKSITDILNRGGRALLPVFALGRAQELLLILDEYWAKHPEYQKIPIYYNSSLARKCMVVYQTYVSAMNDNIKRLFRERMAEAEAAGDVSKGGPWDFRFVRSLKSLERFDDVGGCVMLASPGMMQSGTSRELLEKWAPDPRNGVVITGYSVEGTMAKEIVKEPEEIPCVTQRGNQSRKLGQHDGQQQMKIPRRCTVQEFSFAAHVDGKENMEFVAEVNAPVVILVHGEKGNMNRLKSKLLSFNAQRKDPVKIFSPANCEELRIPFRTDKIAKVVGKLASITPPLPRSKSEGEENGDVEEQPNLISGVLIQHETDFKLSFMAPEDLKEYAGLTTTTIMCKQSMRLSAAGVDLIRWVLEGAFGAIKEEKVVDKEVDGKQVNGNGNGIKEDADEEISRSSTKYVVMDCVDVLCKSGGIVDVIWEGNVINDGIADAVLAALCTVESSPAAVKQSSRQHSHNHNHDSKDEFSLRFKGPHPHRTADPSTRLSRLFLILENQFGADAIKPITHPRTSPSLEPLAPLTTPSTPIDAPNGSTTEITAPYSIAGAPSVTPELSPEDKAELRRLHNLGIPVPGIEIKFDKYAARVWLEDLDVECANKTLKARIKAVVERGVETVSGLWA